MFKSLVCVGFIFGSVSCWAGPGSTGGGNAVVCFNDNAIPSAIRDPKNANYQVLTDDMISNVTSVQVLDLYEALKPRGLDGSLIPDVYPIGADETPVQYVWRLAQRFNPSAPAISWMLSNSLEAFSENNTIMESHGLARIDDTNMVEQIDSRNCVIATMAAQYKAGDNSYRLHIDQRLFNHPAHSKLSKAVLLVHEFVYRYFRDQGESDSRHTRDFVAMIIKNHKLDQEHVYTELKSLGVKTTGYGQEINRAVQAAIVTLRSFQGLADQIVEKTQAVKIRALVNSINSHVRASDRCDDLASCIQMILYKTSKAPDHQVPANLQPFYEKTLEIFSAVDVKLVEAALKDAWEKEVATQNQLNSGDGLDANAMANIIRWTEPFTSAASQFILQIGRTPLTDDQLLEIYVNTGALYGQMIPASNL